MNEQSGPGPIRLENGSGERKPEPSDVFDWIISEFIKKFGTDEFESDRFISINRSVIRLVFPDTNNGIFFMRPFSHLETDRVSKPSLSIFCFPTGRNFLRFAMKILPGLSQGNRRDIPFLSKEGITVSAGRESNTLSLLNSRKGGAVFLFEDMNSLPYYECGSPFKNILQWWFDSKQSAMLHSASISHEGKALLICGRGGAGKSSTALSCMIHGMDYLGDDYVVVSGDNEVSVSSVYNSMKLTSDSLRKFPFLEDGVINPLFKKNEKGVVFFNNKKSNSIPGPLLLKAILLPEINGQNDSDFSRVSSSESFKAVAPSTIFQHIGRRKDIADFIMRLTKILPGYKLKAGTDSKGIFQIVKTICREL